MKKARYVHKKGPIEALKTSRKGSSKGVGRRLLEMIPPACRIYYDRAFLAFLHSIIGPDEKKLIIDGMGR